MDKKLQFVPSILKKKKITQRSSEAKTVNQSRIIGHKRAVDNFPPLTGSPPARFQNTVKKKTLKRNGQRNLQLDRSPKPMKIPRQIQLHDRF